MEVQTSEERWFVLLDLDAVCVGEVILTNAGYLPRYFGTRSAAGDPEWVIGEFLGDVQVGSGFADCRPRLA